MAKILFDIAVAPAPGDAAHGHLVMEISLRIFSYAMIDYHKNLLHLRIYEMDARNNNELYEELQGTIGSDDLLKTATEKKTVIYNFPESELVPEACYAADTASEMIELFHGDLNKGITLSERIPDSPQYNVFRVPAAVHSLLQRSFVNGKYWHYYSLWLQYRQTIADTPASYIQAIFYPNRILVAVVKDRQLQLVQSYGYEAAEDVGYYLLNICDQLQLSPVETPVLLSGMIDASSVLYTEIFKYFAQATLEDFAVPAAAASALQDYPDHFFSPLLKLALCVS
jgi:hypothetical protein